MKSVHKYIFILATASTILSGCIPLIVGTAAVTSINVMHDRRSVGNFIDDQLIESKAKYFLITDVQLKGDTHFNITSLNGVALLTGQAPTPEQKNLAVDIVRSIPQVRQVINEVQVIGKSSLVSRSNDALITSKVKTALFDTKNLSPTRVKIVTEAGNVYLMGLVTEIEGNYAADTARSIAGVQKVIKAFEYIDQ